MASVWGAHSREGPNQPLSHFGGQIPLPGWPMKWRHALPVGASGEGLAFGSTSGGLWISEDGGDA
jgi:hypothetical protein